MGIKSYVGEYWSELWNPDNRQWQHIDRVLFPTLPILAFSAYLLLTKPSSQAWGSAMSSLACIIPLAIWVLFLVVVIPYRLVNKYHYKHEDTIREMVDVYLAGDKLKTAIYGEHDDSEGAITLYKEWGELLAKVFIDNSTELGVKRLIGMKVENTDLTTPIPDDWDKDIAGCYIGLDVQLRKLNLIIQELLSRKG